MSGTVFYTSVDVYGSNVLIREIRDGVRSQRKEYWKPTVYMKDPSGKDWGFRSLYGDNVRPLQPGSIRECKDFTKKYENADGVEVFGQLNYPLQYMSQYAMSDHVFKQMAAFTLDIECKMPLDGGFPKPEHALGEINLITMQNVHTKQCYTFGTIPTPPDAHTYTQYVYCENEAELLIRFLAFWEQNLPDIVTGWNTNSFDLPYVINRIRIVLGELAIKKLSPWGMVECGMRQYKGEEELFFRITGVQCLDYMELMKKFTFGGRESWTLGSVAQEELGETKRVNPGTSFEDFYTNYPNEFVLYNVQDNRLVTGMEDKMKLIELALTVAYKARVNFEDVYSPVKLWDNIIHNILIAENIVIPQREHGKGESHSIIGAYVKEPVPGMYEDVGSIDATSLYPSIMKLLNLSPETYRGMAYSTIELCLDDHYANSDPDLSMGANGALFSRTVYGIIPRLIDTFMVQRKTAKKEMLRLEQEAETFKKNGDKKSADALQNKISSLNNLQMAIKILMNSLYGAMGNKGFRFFNADVAEAITSTGQLYLRSIEKHIDADLCAQFKLEPTKLMVYADTDSVYFTLKDIINKYAPKATGVQRIDLIEKLTVDKIVPAVNHITKKISNKLNAYEHTIIFKNEIAADKTIWLGKKMYICRAHSSEGVRYAKPKYKTMGIALVRSSTPKVVQESLRKSLEVIFSKGEVETQEYIRQAHEDFVKFAVEEVAFPRGVNGLDKYKTSSGVFQKGTPINVRAALLHNQLIDSLGLGDKYEKIGEGDKIKFVYLKMPNPIHQNIIGWSADNKLPVEFGLNKFVDWNTQFDKTFKDAIENIIQPIGWTSEPRASLDAWFS